MTLNYFGMPEREYNKVTETTARRIVLSGNSHKMRAVVVNNNTVATVIEDLLNRRLRGARYSRYESPKSSDRPSSYFQIVLRLAQPGFEFEPEMITVKTTLIL